MSNFSNFSLSRIFRSNSLNVPGAIGSLDSVNSFLASMGGQNKSDSGEVVNHETSLQTSTVWACVNLISKQIATNPFFMYEYDADGKKTLASDHDYFDLIANRPNPEQDAVAFRTAVEVSILLTGNGYIEIQRDGGNRAVALWHRNSDLMEPVHVPTPTALNGRKLVYKCTDSLNREVRMIPYENVIHIMGMTRDGWTGLSPIGYHRSSIGGKIAMDKFGNRFFANNATPSGILTATHKVTPEDKLKMRADWEMLQSGGNQHRVSILDRELKFQQISIPQNDAQYLESKGATEKEIAAIFGVPAYAIGLLDKGIKANVEQQNQDLYNFCLRPEMAKWEKAYSTKLLPSKGRSANRYVCGFDMFAFLHPDSQSLITSNQSSIQNGIISPNEGRAMLGLNSIGPVGDKHYVQLNMQTLELANATTDTSDMQPDNEVILQQETNSLPKRLGQNYRGLFADGVQRVIKSGSKDYKAVYRCLWPTLDALSGVARAEVNTDDRSECDKAVEKLIEGMAHRAAKWSAETLDTICDEEMKRVAKSLIFSAHADLANSNARKLIAQLEEDEAEQDALATGE